jgi:hypothetical protein
MSPSEALRQHVPRAPTMNMNISALAIESAIPVDDRSKVVRLIESHSQLQALSQSLFWSIPDAAMDLLAKAEENIKEAICRAPVTSSADIAAKLRFAAALIEDDEGGHLYAEANCLYAALKDLAEYRIRQEQGCQAGWIDSLYPQLLEITAGEVIRIEHEAAT